MNWFTRQQPKKLDMNREVENLKDRVQELELYNANLKDMLLACQAYIKKANNRLGLVVTANELNDWVGPSIEDQIETVLKQKTCMHYWIDATNEKVSGTALCLKCLAITSLNTVSIHDPLQEGIKKGTLKELREQLGFAELSQEEQEENLRTNIDSITR